MKKALRHELKLTELKSIFKGEKQRWRNGNKITIALMKTNTPAGAYTCKKIYDMSGDEVKKFWLALVFQGKADAPEFFNSVAELESFVADNPGAIGIIDQPQTSARCTCCFNRWQENLIDNFFLKFLRYIVFR